MSNDPAAIKLYNTLGIPDYGTYEEYAAASVAMNKKPVPQTHYNAYHKIGDTSTSSEGDTTVTVSHTEEGDTTVEVSEDTSTAPAAPPQVTPLPKRGSPKNKSLDNPSPDAPPVPGQKSAVVHNDRKDDHPQVRTDEQKAEDAINGHCPENTPQFNKADDELVLNGRNNTWIVLGRDRPGSILSGYMGRQHTQSGAIDIVVGRMGHLARAKDDEGNPIAVDNDFIRDAARIYIAQKANVDKDFNLVNGGVGDGNVKSAIALKADHIRVVAREGIKLVTRTDEKNSQGGKIKSTLGIDLIAGNEEHSLQPMVKGENLKEAIERLVHHVDKLNGIIMGLVTSQMQFNSTVALHVHHSPFGGAPTSPSPTVVTAGIETMIKQVKDTTRSLMTHKANLQIYKAKYLTPVADCWILSRHNKAN